MVFFLVCLFFVFLVYWLLFFLFIAFLVFPLNWDRLGSHKIDPKIAQNLNFGEVLQEITVKHSVFASFKLHGIYSVL